MSTHIDFNCDLGEGGGDDAAIIPCISSASIACGGHAGDAQTLRDTLRLCRRHGVAAGAHPSYPDRAHFGRRVLDLCEDELHLSLQQQLALFSTTAKQEGVAFAHVKPHGALYNRAAVDPLVADVVIAAVRALPERPRLYALSGSLLAERASAAGLHVVHEVFAERGYRADGTLAPREHPGAVIDTLDAALTQVRQLLQTGHVTALDGTHVALRADSLCLHGDRPDAAHFAHALRDALQADGIVIRSPGVRA